MAVVGDGNHDVIVIDGMFSTALNVGLRFQRPTAVVVHTFFDRIFSFWQSNLDFRGELREKAGLGSHRGRHESPKNQAATLSWLSTKQEGEIWRK